MYNNTATILTLTFSLFFTACSGGGGSSVPSGGAVTADVVTNLEAVATGGSQKIGINVADTSPIVKTGCNYTSSIASDSPALAQKLRNLGITKINYTSTEFCATSGSEIDCIRQVGQGVVIDKRLVGLTSIEVFMPNLLSNHYTNVEFTDFININQFTNIYSATKDNTVGTNGVCTSTQPLHTIGVINDSWTGYQLNYSPISKSGSTSPATATCNNQSCSIIGTSNASFSLTNFVAGDGWHTSTGSATLAGASISSDLQLLSMYTCTTPFDKLISLEKCSFFSFKRASSIAK